MGGIGIDLDDRRIVWIELAPGKVGTEQQQHIAVEDRVIASPPANDPGHPDIVRVVVLDKVLATGGVRHRRFEARRRGHNLVMRTGAAGAGIDRDCIAFVEDGRDRIEVCLTRPDEGASSMNGVR